MKNITILPVWFVVPSVIGQDGDLDQSHATLF